MHVANTGLWRALLINLIELIHCIPIIQVNISVKDRVNFPLVKLRKRCMTVESHYPVLTSDRSKDGFFSAPFLWVTIDEAVICEWPNPVEGIHRLLHIKALCLNMLWLLWLLLRLHRSCIVSWGGILALAGAGASKTDRWLIVQVR